MLILIASELQIRKNGDHHSDEVVLAKLPDALRGAEAAAFLLRFLFLVHRFPLWFAVANIYTKYRLPNAIPRLFDERAASLHERVGFPRERVSKV